MVRSVEKILLILLGVGSAVPALFFILLAGADWRVWNCEYNGQTILAAVTVAAVGISVSTALWLKISPNHGRSKLKILLLPWIVLVAPTLFMLFIGPQRHLVSIRNEAHTSWH
jgi:hypothetical protein